MASLGNVSTTLKIDIDTRSLKWALLHVRVIGDWFREGIAIDRLLNGR